MTNGKKCGIIISYKNSMNWGVRMHLTLEQDYAIRVAYELCKASKFIDVGDLAAKTGISRAYAQKIMFKLSKSPLFISKKGVDGGYMLAEGISPSDISFYDILKAMGEELYVNSCLSGKYTCTRPEVVEHSGECEIRKLMQFLNTEWITHLKSLTFDMVINKIN